jgi:hypothetical protein
MHVVIAHYNEDLSWVTKLNYPFTVISRNKLPEDTGPNKGNEASVFLDYIVRHYDSLDEYTAFVHGHRTSWHHAEPIDEKLNRIEYTRPYWGLNDIPPFLIRNCPDTLNQMLMNYPLVEPILGPLDMARISFRMGGQFYVHRDAIRSRPRETYEALLAVILGNTGRSKTDGILFERIWHFIFTHNVVDA